VSAEEKDYGLGLCLPCVLQRGRKNPHLAVTQAPLPYPVPAPDGSIAGIAGVVVPVCHEHVRQGLPGGDTPRRPLLVAGGSIP
jgi:hypothetical protein